MKTIREFFFFFILGAGTHEASHGISGDLVLVRMRVVRLLLQAVTSECLRKRGEKKREGERASVGGREWMRVGEGGCCCRLKKQRSCSELPHRQVLGLEETLGSPASHRHLACPSLPALRSAAPARPSNGRPLHRPAPSSAHTPRGLTLLWTPTSSTLVFVMLFFARIKTPLLCSLKWFLDFFLNFHRGKQGVQVISSCR